MSAGLGGIKNFGGHQQAGISRPRWHQKFDAPLVRPIPPTSWHRPDKFTRTGCADVTTAGRRYHYFVLACVRGQASSHAGRFASEHAGVRGSVRSWRRGAVRRGGAMHGGVLRAGLHFATRYASRRDAASHAAALVAVFSARVRCSRRALYAGVSPMVRRCVGRRAWLWEVRPGCSAPGLQCTSRAPAVARLPVVCCVCVCVRVRVRACRLREVSAGVCDVMPTSLLPHHGVRQVGTWK